MKFVYYWENKITGQWYIGSRTAAGCHINDGYICSSKIAKPLIMASPDEWSRVILFEHEDPKVVIAKETELLMEFDAAHDALALNRHNGGKFSNAGNQHTDETRAKMSAWQIGRKHTAETRAKISAAAACRVGKKHTDESRAKISKSNIGKIISEETRAKMSACQIGKIASAETREKIRVAKTGKKHTGAEETWWYHPVHDKIWGPVSGLAEKYELNRQSLDKVKNGRSKYCHGWVTDESILNKLICNPTTDKWRISK